MSHETATTRRTFLRDAGCLALGASLAGCAKWGSGRAATTLPGPEPGKRLPNIVFILADDLGWGELGCYGNAFNETPVLDRLASEGMRFTQAYAAGPVCSPTRASIITGQYPARCGITDFLSPKSTEFLNPADHFTINEALSRAGFHTGIIGKWHLNTQIGVNPGDPTHHGFDEAILCETQAITKLDYFFPYYFIEGIEGKEGEYLTERQGDEAVRFIDRNAKDPFFLYLTFHAVHAGLDAPQEKVDKYRKKYEEKYGPGSAKPFDRPKNVDHRGKPDNPYMGAMLESVDTQVGRILDQLEKSGIADNTLVIFFSDNGGAPWDSNNGELRNCKTWLHEGGIRVPLIMRLPGVIAPGSTTETPVCSVDFYPTFAQLVGAGPIREQKLDGESILPLMKGTGSPGRDTLYWHYPANTAHWQNQMASAVRQGDFKLLQFYKDGRVELFNLRDDPGENNNLAATLPAKRKAMFELLQQWKKEVGAVEPVIE